MKKTLLLATLYLTTLLSFGQQKEISGFIVDSINKPIEYASIGVLNKPIGTVSNLEGKFKIIISDDEQNDTIRISCLGYKNKDILVKNFTENNLKIKLDIFTQTLAEVIITSNKLKEYTDGKLKTNTKNQCIFANPDLKNLNLGSEIGRKFKLGNEKASVLTKFKFFIKDNNFDYVKFRINIYTISNNKPDRKINTENIFASAGKNFTDWIEIDLTKYNIVVQNDIIITVEWIEHSSNGNKLNLPIIIPSFGSTHYYKFGSQNSWQRYGNLSSSMYLTYNQ